MRHQNPELLWEQHQHSAALFHKILTLSSQLNPVDTIFTYPTLVHGLVDASLTWRSKVLMKQSASRSVPNISSLLPWFYLAISNIETYALLFYLKALFFIWFLISLFTQLGEELKKLMTTEDGSSLIRIQSSLELSLIILTAQRLWESSMRLLARTTLGSTLFL